jgi:hypothetical protein
MDWLTFLGPALLVGNGRRSGFFLDDCFSPASTRYLARGGGTTGVVGSFQPRSHTRPRLGP